jgi:hypothetical protein
MIDENREGFSIGRNTIRYLHRLTACIKGDIAKKLTVLCLLIFIDFEKAFDPVWKKGLVVKLWGAGHSWLLLENHRQLSVWQNSKSTHKWICRTCKKPPGIWAATGLCPL